MPEYICKYTNCIYHPDCKNKDVPQYCSIHNELNRFTKITYRKNYECKENA